MNVLILSRMRHIQYFKGFQRQIFKPKQVFEQHKNPCTGNLKFMSNGAHEHRDLQRLKRGKRFFAFGLFGVTLVAAMIFKKRKAQYFKELLHDAEILPKDQNFSVDFILYKFKGYTIPLSLLKGTLQTIQKNFEVKPDDIYTISFPKTGTTWVQELVYLIGTDLNYEAAKSKSIGERFPFLEFVYPGVSAVTKMESPRFIKTHLPFSLLFSNTSQETRPKIIYIMRNPKDVLVSYYHFVRMVTVMNYKGSFQEFFQAFVKGNVPYGPIWKHYKEALDHQFDDNVLVLRYEDLHNDINTVIQKIAEFMGKSLTQDQIEQLAKHTSFQKMAENPSVNYDHWDSLGFRNKDEAKFFRKGIVGDWKNYFDDNMDLQLSEIFRKNFTKKQLEQLNYF